MNRLSSHVLLPISTTNRQVGIFFDAINALTRQGSIKVPSNRQK